jgi:hypothetical protein
MDIEKLRFSTMTQAGFSCIVNHERRGDMNIKLRNSASRNSRIQVRSLPFVGLAAVLMAMLAFYPVVFADDTGLGRDIGAGVDALSAA